jgi:hypothetical protein
MKIEVSGPVSISVDKLLAKMEEELRLAKGSAKGESLRERVYSIKILCELILDEKQPISELPVNPAPAPFRQQQSVQQPMQPFQQPPMQVFQQPIDVNQPKKMEMDDEANGDSLFDF